MKVVVHKGLISTKLIDSWDTHASTIQPVEGKISVGNVLDTDTRNCEVRWITFAGQSNLYKSIATEILPIVDAESLTFRTETYRALEIQHTTYNKDGHYIRHSDIDLKTTGNNSVQRKISMVVQLSDPTDYEGGNLIIEDQVASREKGTIILFPPYMVHGVTKVLSGIRKSLAIWVYGPAWR